MDGDIILKRRDPVDRLRFNIGTVEKYLRLINSAIELFKIEIENAQVEEPPREREWFTNAQSELLDMEEELKNKQHGIFPWSQGECEWILKVCQGKLAFDAKCIESQVRQDIWLKLWAKYHEQKVVSLDAVKKIVMEA